MLTVAILGGAKGGMVFSSLYLSVVFNLKVNYLAMSII